MVEIGTLDGGNGPPVIPMPPIIQEGGSVHECEAPRMVSGAQGLEAVRRWLFEPTCIPPGDVVPVRTWAPFSAL